ncbi:proteasome inhibitor PI31 subunit [Drosophila miranda]|uniref:proteasome inhibitor PI31 subunit n=1 Tax=Drosophila miranda TaxID=7229 RepID=UPI00143F4EFB|nr:proteasome inhibitor PI31 subunit [Drosophila miranda]
MNNTDDNGPHAALSSSFVSLRSVGTTTFEAKTVSGSEDDQFYGWQLLFYSIRRSIRKKADLLLALAHFLVTKQYHLRSVDPEHGQGIRMSAGSRLILVDPGRGGSELLPMHWNRESPKYRLHYVDELDHQYVMLARLTHQDLVINLQNWTSKRMSITCLQPENLVQSLHNSDLGQCIPTAHQVMHHLRVYLVNPVVRGRRKGLPESRPDSLKGHYNLCHSVTALGSEKSE